MADEEKKHLSDEDLDDLLEDVEELVQSVKKEDVEKAKIRSVALEQQVQTAQSVDIEDVERERKKLLKLQRKGL